MSQKPEPMSMVNYKLLATQFGTLGIVWQPTHSGEIVQRVFLPSPPSEAEQRILRAYPGSRAASCPAIDELADETARFLQGEAVHLNVHMLALDNCPQFQQRVLVAESQIPRGWVSTYGRIAAHVGSPRGARAVGGALARNPFPIIIPCHRAIQSDGSLGGFQGGQDMKRALLQLEGVAFTAASRVVMDRVYY